MEHFNKLAPAEAERIAILMEECGEVIQACGKILRHGYESYNPFSAIRTTNREELAEELGDLSFSIDHIVQDINEDILVKSKTTRQARMLPYLHHQE